MNPRARMALMIGMAAWTLFTAAAGLYAMNGTSAQSGDANEGRAVLAAGTPGRTGTPSSGTRTITSATRTTTTGTRTTTAVTQTPVVITRTPANPWTATAIAATATSDARATRTAIVATATSQADETSTAVAATATSEAAATFTAVPTFTPTSTATSVPPTWTATSIPPTKTPRGPTSTPHPYPIPQYAQNAGADGSAVSGGGRTISTLRDAALLPSRGVVVLDPGHGRGDPGAVHYLPDGTPDVLEADSNLRNAILIKDELSALGYEVYLTRDDAGRAPDGPLVQQFITSDLIWRAQLADAVDADVFLALHGNGASVTSISGPETWYCGYHEQGSANERLAALVQQATMDSLREYGYFPPNRGIVEDAGRHHSGDFCEFVVTRETTVPSALMEYLFLSNDDDARVLADDRAHEVLARHIAAALDRFLTTDR